MSIVANVRFTINVDSTTLLVPGSAIPVTVTIITNIPIEIKRVLASVLSSGACTMVPRFLNRDDMGVVPLGCMEEYTDHEFEPLYLSSAESPLFLHEGQGRHNESRHRITGTLTLPQDLADSWSYEDIGKDAGAINILKVGVVYCRIDGRKPAEEWNEVLLRKDVRLKIRQNFVVETVGFHQPSTTTLATPTLIGQLTVLDRAVVVGQEVPVEVHITNNSFMFTRRVTLYLCKEYRLKYSHPVTAMAEYRTIVVKVKRVTLPNVRPHRQWERVVRGFTVPENCETTNSVSHCSFAMIRFFIRLKVTQWIRTSQKCSIDVTIGTHSDQEYHPESNLQVYNVQ